MALMRALRIELRRSVAAGTVLLLIALGAVDLFWGGGGAAGGWAAMTFAQRTSLLLLWPLAIGAGAWQARRERVAGVAELFVTSPRSPAQRLAPVAAALAIAVVVAYLMMLLVGTARVGLSPADMYFTLEGGVAAAVGALSLVSAAWLGLWLGRFIPSAFTAPVVTMLGVALMTLLDELDMRVSGPAFSLLVPALEIPYQRDHVQLPLGVSGQQGLWLAALAVTAFAVTTAASRRGQLLALVPVALAALIVIPTLPPGDTDSVYAEDKDARRLVCTQDAPKICVMRVHSGILDEVTGPAREALRVMAFLPEAPTSVAEVPLPAPRGPGSIGQENPEPKELSDPRTVPLTVYLDRNGHYDELENLIGTLVDGAGTPECGNSEWSFERLERYYAARGIAGAWLSRESGVAAPASASSELFDRGWKALTALPVETQRERLIAFRADALRCRGDLYADLTRESA
jgi:hypothetical protein